MPPLPAPLADALAAELAVARTLLANSLRIPSPSGHEREFTQFIAAWAAERNFHCDLFETNESALAPYPQARAKHIPLTKRPTLVISLPRAASDSPGRSVIFNAHADTVPAPNPDKWSFPPYSGRESNGRFYGRGACDVKGPLAASLCAMAAFARISRHEAAGNVSLELVPGEEDCVGLGTLTSYARGYKDFDAAIVLEPTENRPCCASRSGLRFLLTLQGLSVHGTVKWLGVDAIALLPKVLSALKQLELNFQDPAADPLFAQVPFTRPITVDQVHAGDWQGMVADRCTIAGYFELLPTDDLSAWKARFEKELRTAIAAQGEPDSAISVDFTEEYTGHRTAPDHALCRLAANLYADPNLAAPTAFNSGCEAGFRAATANTPTLVWGPGSLAQAHAIDEYVEWSAVEEAAKLFACFLFRWTRPETA